MEDGFTKVFNGTPGFQLLTAVDTLHNEVVGFLTAQRGECQLKPDVWSVNLICSGSVYDARRPGSTLPQDVQPLAGIVILGAMCYSLRTLGRPYAVLELAGGYTNTRGFLSYSKLGFIKNLSLFNNGDIQGDRYVPRCFYDPGNLPMYVSLDQFSPQIIQDLVTGRKKLRLTHEQDDTGIYANYYEGRTTQRDVAIRKNAFYRIFLCLKPRHLRLIDGSRMNAVDKSFVKNQAAQIPEALRDIIPDVVVLPPQVYDIVTIRGGTRRKKRTRRRTDKKHRTRNTRR
jgi:hypothetical protein